MQGRGSRPSVLAGLACRAGSTSSTMPSACRPVSAHPTNHHGRMQPRCPSFPPPESSPHTGAASWRTAKEPGPPSPRGLERVAILALPAPRPAAVGGVQSVEAVQLAVPELAGAKHQAPLRGSDRACEGCVRQGAKAAPAQASCRHAASMCTWCPTAHAAATLRTECTCAAAAHRLLLVALSQRAWQAAATRAHPQRTLLPTGRPAGSPRPSFTMSTAPLVAFASGTRPITRYRLAPAVRTGDGGVGGERQCWQKHLRLKIPKSTGPRSAPPPPSSPRPAAARRCPPPPPLNLHPHTHPRLPPQLTCNGAYHHLQGGARVHGGEPDLGSWLARHRLPQPPPRCGCRHDAPAKLAAGHLRWGAATACAAALAELQRMQGPAECACAGGVAWVLPLRQTFNLPQGRALWAQLPGLHVQRGQLCCTCDCRCAG